MKTKIRSSLCAALLLVGAVLLPQHSRATDDRPICCYDNDGGALKCNNSDDCCCIYSQWTGKLKKFFCKSSDQPVCK